MRFTSTGLNWASFGAGCQWKIMNLAVLDENGQTKQSYFSAILLSTHEKDDRTQVELQVSTPKYTTWSVSFCSLAMSSCPKAFSSHGDGFAAPFGVEKTWVKSLVPRSEATCKPWTPSKQRSTFPGWELPLWKELWGNRISFNWPTDFQGLVRQGSMTHLWWRHSVTKLLLCFFFARLKKPWLVVSGDTGLAKSSKTSEGWDMGEIGYGWFSSKNAELVKCVGR